jgi:hypothetical protein
VESLNTRVLPACPEPVAVVDVRKIPLGQLSSDRDARRMADRIVAGATAGSSLIAAVNFNSAI